MDEQQQAWGSNELTPEAIRSARFTMRDGAYAPAEVHEFLEQVASAMEVLQATDVAQAMRRELQRNAEISSRVVMAGQETAERLRQQAANDARSIIEDTKRLAEQLRDASRQEQQRTREHIDSMRRAFIEEMRDMYDRIGASLYRFERAGEAAQAEAAAPQGEGSTTWGADLTPGWNLEQSGPASSPQSWEQPSEPASNPPAWEQPSEPASNPQEWEPQPESVWAEQHGTEEPGLESQGAAPGWDPQPERTPEQIAGELPPAWTQLENAIPLEPPPPAGGEAIWNQTSSETESVEETEPPLVDLRGIQEQIHAEPPGDPAGEFQAEPATESHADASSGWLEVPAEERTAPAAGDPAAAAPVEQPPASQLADEIPDTNAAVAEPAPEPSDDERAEALLAGTDFVANEPPPLPEPPSLSGNGEGGVDVAGIQHFVLQSLNEGQARDTIEQYLQANYGIADPANFVDEALASGGQPG